jgi:SAM-dependent methyltransferase
MCASMDDLRHNYEVERKLADRLRAASPEARRSMYRTVYDEFFQQARNVEHTIDNPRAVAREVRIVTSFLPEGGRYLEVGAGTCRVASQVALSSSKAYAVEVSAEIVPPDAGVEVLLSDGVTIPVEAESVDLVYSNQLMEHLHPDDATEQVRNIRRALAQGGMYVCITPNRLSGPHDVSQYFADTAQGFHLREYTIRELRSLFLEAGFSDVRVGIALGGEILVVVPGSVYAFAETVLARLPVAMRRRHPWRKFFSPGVVIAMT